VHNRTRADAPSCSRTPLGCERASIDRVAKGEPVKIVSSVAAVAMAHVESDQRTGAQTLLAESSRLCGKAGEWK
jgi:hypothetical protein